MLYLDTSALLPYYRQEPTSDRVQALLTNNPGQVAISDLGRVEFASALAQWLRTGECTTDDVRRIAAVFDNDLQMRRFHMFTLDPTVFSQALVWLRNHSTALRTLDALHLGLAHVHGASLVTADTQLASAARVFAVPLVFLDHRS